MRCPVCLGEGEMMGGGFMMQTCTRCAGDGYIHEFKQNLIEHQATKEVDKRSKSYKDAVKSIQKEYDCSYEEARKYFDEEYEKLS